MNRVAYGNFRRLTPEELVRAIHLDPSQSVERLGEKYEVDELAMKYRFTGRKSLTIPQAIAVKEELEEIDRLLKQLE